MNSLLEVMAFVFGEKEYVLHYRASSPNAMASSEKVVVQGVSETIGSEEAALMNAIVAFTFSQRSLKILEKSLASPGTCHCDRTNTL